MRLLNLTSKSSNDTMNIAKSLAKSLSSGDTVVLTGELGSGKTKFTEGFLSYFGLENEISSPTFNIVNEYSKNSVNIYHFDVYRLSDIEEFYAIGGEEYFEKGICLIEWGELIEDALPLEYIHISFEKNNDDPNLRLLKLEALGNKYELILDKLKEDLNWKF
mgnify:CR=1 FL=1